jgi:hypothetical protein
LGRFVGVWVMLRGGLESSRMKRCRTCNRTFTDPNLAYCIDDGTPLTSESDDDAPYRPPSSYVPPEAMPAGKRRKSWPWILGILAAFLLGVIALSVAAAIFVPRMVRSRQQPIAVGKEKTEQPVDTSAPVPTDEQDVLAQLTDIENEWTVANINADRAKLDRILADDYVGQSPSPERGLQGKKEYLDTLQRDSVIERWEFNDLKVDLIGDRATLTGKITFFGSGQQETFNFTDKFVWRNGRWQAIGSEVSSTR